MAIAKVLLVDDDENVRFGLGELLESSGFEITTAASVPEALKLIISETYDVLLSDLHMPGAGDGLTVVSAMRHAHPRAVTLLLTAYPEMGAATHAILLQADQILVKPMKLPALVEVIKQRLASGRPGPRAVESVATILERSAQSNIDDWFERVQRQEKLMAVPLSYEERCGHLPQVFRDLVYRLRSSEPLGTREVLSIAATQHGATRRKYGYTAAMLVEESRMLQVSIFQTLQNNLANIDFSALLIGVMTIADEVDSQLSQAMESYLTQSR
jgi:CheY-like chemotaxis protein